MAFSLVDGFVKRTLRSSYSRGFDFRRLAGSVQLYTFDRRLNLLRVDASNDYLKYHTKMFEEGNLDHSFDPTELERYRSLFHCGWRNADGNGAQLRDCFNSSSHR
jgi:hypothetical protein